MQLIDISLTLSEDLPIWPGDPAVQLERISEIQNGADANVTKLTMTVHTGTHVDAPAHFLDGRGTVDRVALDLLVGPAAVVEIQAEGMLTPEHLEEAGIAPHTKRLLFKTPNSRWWAEGETAFQEDFVAIGKEAAEYLVNLGVEVIGVDYLSVAPFHQPVPTHQILLDAGVLIIEGLDLSKAKPGDYSLLCLPLKIAGADGAPARALLLR